MKVEQPRRATALALAAALLTGGCAVHVGPVEGKGPAGINAAQRGLLLQDGDRNGILDNLERVQKTRTCQAEPCTVLVSVAGKVSPTTPTGFDCGLSLDADVLVFTRPVTRLAWVLQQPAGSENDYRFRPDAAGQRSPSGVYLYAKEAQSFFGIVEALPTRYVLATKQRALQGYAYGVYVDWKPKGSAEGKWEACNALDPIIMDIP